MIQAYAMPCIPKVRMELLSHLNDLFYIHMQLMNPISYRDY